MSAIESREDRLQGRYTATPVSGYRRRRTRAVNVGGVGVGDANPIRIQSMTITDTMDTAATVRESIQLYEAGSEIVRITAPSWKDAENLGVIKAELKRQGYDFPICADIHFSPKAAMAAVEHVEKVRVNPGNYVDSKKFKVREYTDVEYAAELERLDEAFAPLVLRAKELGRALRIGTNHGSLSDRILNRYGDTPAGMVESAVEFIQIAERRGFHDIIISMKASNVQVMVQAYRMLVERMDLEGMDYPLHLGVTEAGDGQDGRIKSAAGIGSLLADGLGDTIRVSLTEDPVHELPVARALVNRFAGPHTPVLTGEAAANRDEHYLRGINPYEYNRRPAAPVFEKNWPPRAMGPVALALPVDFGEIGAKSSTPAVLAGALREGVNMLLFRNAALDELADFITTHAALLAGAKKVLELKPSALSESVSSTTLPDSTSALDGIAATVDPAGSDLESVLADLKIWHAGGLRLFVDLNPAEKSTPEQLKSTLRSLQERFPERLTIAIGGDRSSGDEITRRYRLLHHLIEEDLPSRMARPPLLLRARLGDLETGLYDASFGLGGLLVDGIGDAILCEFQGAVSIGENLRLGLDILQAMRLRMSKTEFISCPSCGRTLFDLQETTARIKERTGHLKGVKIAIMGCIVNGPGEMADADFGYVGAGPGKIHLYRGQELVKANIPSEDADAQLVELIKEHDMWVEPDRVALAATAPD